MTTSNIDFDDTATVRRRFLQAVAATRGPIRAKDLTVPGLDRRTIQKRIERRRRAAGGLQVGDEDVIAYARDQLDRSAGSLTRGLARLRELGSPRAREFAAKAGLQTTVIGDWVELAHSPGDRGWTRSQIAVQELSRTSVLGRGRTQSWLREKKAYLKWLWAEARNNPELRRDLVPNQLKMDLVQLAALGTEDSPTCAIQIAPVDWLTCLALNSRLDSSALTRGTTVRDQWAEPRAIIERRLLPGMIVGYIVVATSDRRFLVCQRQPVGIRDEPGTWSLSIEERWSGSLTELRDRQGQTIQHARGPDRHPHDLVMRAVREELGIEVALDDVRVLSWGIEASVLYPGLIAIAARSGRARPRTSGRLKSALAGCLCAGRWRAAGAGRRSQEAGPDVRRRLVGAG